MVTVLYILWILLPLFFFTVALWAKLESISNKDKKQNTSDFLRQGVFVSVCVALAILIDQKVLASLVESYSPTFIPLGFYQIMLLPTVLYVLGVIIGPTKAINIYANKQKNQKKKRR